MSIQTNHSFCWSAAEINSVFSYIPYKMSSRIYTKKNACKFRCSNVNFCNCV